MTPLCLCLVLWPHALVPFRVQRSHRAAGQEVFDVISESQKIKEQSLTKTICQKIILQRVKLNQSPAGKSPKIFMEHLAKFTPTA